MAKGATTFEKDAATVDKFENPEFELNAVDAGARADDSTGAKGVVDTMHSTLFGEAAAGDATVYGDKTDAELRQSWFGLLHPNTTLRQLYDGVQMSILLYFLYILPYRIGFSITPSAGAAVLDVVIDFLLAVDIFVMFHSYYYCNTTGLLVYHKASIKRHYFRTWFIIDFLTVAPFDQIFRIVQLASTDPAFKHMVSMVANEVRVVKLCRLLKLGKLVELIDPQKLSTLLAAALEPLGIHGVALAAMFYMRIAVLVFTLVSFTHILACWWGGIGLQQAQNGTGWVVAQWGDDALDRTAVPNTDIYSASMYFVIVTLSSTGYGDIHATTTREQFCCYVFILFGVFVIAYIVGTFGMMIANIAADANRFDTKMRSIASMMNKIATPYDVKAQVNEFYARKANHSVTAKFREVYLELPGEVRHCLMKARYSEILQQIPFLRNMHDRMMVKVCATVKEFSTMSGDIICRRGDKRQDIIMITTGLVTIMPYANGEPFEDVHLDELHDTHGRLRDIPGQDRESGSYFGADEFIGLSDSASVTLKARIYTEVAVLSRGALSKVFEEFPALEHRLAAYALAQRELNDLLADGPAALEAHDMSDWEQRLTQRMTLAPDEVETYKLGEISMENVLLHDEGSGVKLSERMRDLEQRMGGLEDSMGQVLSLLKGKAR